MNTEIVFMALLYGYLFILLVSLAGYATLLLINRLSGNRYAFLCTPAFFLFTGLIIFVTAYSILKTGGNTIMLLNIAVFILFVAALKKYPYPALPSVNGQSAVKKLTQTFTKSTVFYLLLCGFILLHIPGFSGDGWNATPASDFVWYVDVVEGLKKAGAENVQGQYNFFNDTASMREPYHYFELWLAAGFSQLTGISSFYATVFFPFLAMGLIIMLLLEDIFLLFSSDKIWRWIIPFAAFFGPIKYFSIAQAGDMYQILPFAVPKYQLFQMFLLFFCWILLRTGRREIAFSFILFLPVVSISAAIPVIGGLGVVAAVGFLKDKRFFHALKLLLPCIVVLLCILLYYIINNRVNPQFYQFAADLKMAGLTEGLRTKLNIIAATAFIILFFLPLIILTLFILLWGKIKIRNFFDNENLSLSLFVVGGSVAGLLGWLVFFNTVDSAQLFQNFVIPALTVLLTAFFIKAVAQNAHNRIRVKSLAAFAFILLFVAGFMSTFNARVYYHPFTPTQRYSAAFLRNADKFLGDGDSTKLIATGNAPAYYINRFNRNEKVYTPCLPLKRNDPSVVALSVTGDFSLKAPRTHFYDAGFAALTEKSPFIRYMTGKREDIYDIQAADSCRVNFIKDMGIDFFVAGKDFTMPVTIQKYLSADSIVDSYTGTRLYKLSYK